MEVKCPSVKIFISDMFTQICFFVGFYVPSSNGPLFIAAELKEKLSCLLLGCDQFYFIKLADMAYWHSVSPWMCFLAHNICQKPWVNYSWCLLSCHKHQKLNETWLKLYTTTVIWTMTIHYRHLSPRISVYQVPKSSQLITNQRRNMDEINGFMFNHVTDNNIYIYIYNII